MPWNAQTIEDYLQYARQYISNFTQKIDCADLALSSLVDFAGKRKLPLRFRYYSGGWKWYAFVPATDDPASFKSAVIKDLGALNVIDNSRSIMLASARPGDLIMSRWSGTLGHTRIIYDIRYDAKKKDHHVIWYQGNLPPVVPERREAYFSEINGVYEKSPRRWNFEQFSA